MQVGTIPHLGTHSTLPLAGAGFCPQVDQILGGNVVITIHKYDMTAAQKGGVDLSQFTATGKQDAKAEEALTNEFS